MQSVLTTQTESVWRLKGTVRHDQIITPNLTIFDKHLLNEDGSNKLLRPTSITTNLQTMQHEVELIEVVNDVIIEG